MIDTASLNLLWSDRLMDGLAAAGVTHVVLSPGSRSTPLVLALNRHPELHSRQHPDERAAAFFALGMASRQRRPVALIATSGSAPAHWLPAVIEANRSGVPLLLLSADRPPELQACGANQTVDQIHLFGSQVRGFFEAGPPQESPQALAHIRRLGVQATHLACWPNPGPVHINLPFREPLTPSHWPAPPIPGPKVPIGRNPVRPDPDQLARVARILSSGPGLVICGPAPREPGFAAAVTALAGRLGCPLLADPLSELRSGGHDHAQVISRYDGMLRSGAFTQGEGPSWVLRFGAAPVSKSLLAYLAGSDAAQILCAPRGDWPDPLHRTAEMIRAEPRLVCEGLLEMALPQGPEAWLARFTRAERLIDAILLAPEATPTEDLIIRELLDTLPAGAILFSGNSLPIRQLDLWSGQRDAALRIMANRGASGIDGNVSTLLGLAAAGPGPVIGLLGDLALFHDMNGLLFARESDGVIIVLNNGGGGIFGMLPQARLETFEQQWLMPTGLDLGHAARLYGLTHRRIRQPAEFRPALEQALRAPGVDLIEVMLDRQASLARQERYLETATAALQAADVV